MFPAIKNQFNPLFVVCLFIPLMLVTAQLIESDLIQIKYYAINTKQDAWLALECVELQTKALV